MLKILITLIIFLTTLSVDAAEPELKEERFIDRFHLSFSSNILRSARRIDSFFGDERAFEEANTSRVQIYTAATFREAEAPAAEANYHIKLVLPRTEEKYRLIVENTKNAVQESDSVDSTVTSSTSVETTGIQPETERSLTGAIRYILSLGGLKTSFDIGLRYTSKIELYYKIRIRRGFTFGKWAFRPAEEYTWIHDEGHSSDTNLDFDRSLSPKWHFRIANSVYWNSRENTYYFSNGPSWYQTLNEKMALSYDIRAQTSYDESHSKDNYAVSVSFRQLLYKNWFYWTITPAFNYPKKLEYYRTPSLTIRFDTVFGKI